MLRTTRRYIATLSLTLLLAPTVAGCMTTQAGQLIVPTDSIVNAFHHRVAKGRSAGLVVGLAALTALVAGAVAFGNNPLFSAR